MNVDEWTFRFHKKHPIAADTEAIVGCLRAALHLDGIFMNDFFVSFAITLAVVDIPGKRFEEWANELTTGLCLVVGVRTILSLVLSEAFDEFLNDCGCWHVIPARGLQIVYSALFTSQR